MVADAGLSKPVDFRGLILNRLKEIGWNKATIARHNLVTMHPTSVFRYFRGDRDTDGSNVAELLYVLGWEFGKGFCNPPITPAYLRNLDNPSKKSSVDREALVKIFPEEPNHFKVVEKLRSRGGTVEDVVSSLWNRKNRFSLGEIAEALNRNAVPRKNKKGWDRKSVWKIVEKVNRKEGAKA